MNIGRLSRTLASQPYVCHVVVADVEGRRVVVDTRVSAQHRGRFDDFSSEFGGVILPPKSSVAVMLVDTGKGKSWVRNYVKVIVNSGSVKGVLAVGLPMHTMASYMYLVKQITIFTYVAIALVASVGIRFWQKSVLPNNLRLQVS